MSKASAKNISLKDVLEEVRALRRDVSIIMPTESIDQYVNQKEIVSAYRLARKQISRTKKS